MKIYKNPPVIEAVCELRFSETREFSADNIDAFSRQIEEFFPIKKNAKRNEVELRVDTSTDQQEIDRRVFEFPQYLSSDEKYVVQIEANRVSIHRLRPYTAWSKFLPLIESVLLAYEQNFGLSSLARIGLRYINHIESVSSPSEAFTLKIDLPEGAKGNVVSSFIGVVESVGEEGDMLRISLGDRETEQGTIHVLDIDYYKESELGSVEKYIEWANIAHTKVEDAFESILTANVKAKFDT